jgi:hypothetical protein
MFGHWQMSKRFRRVLGLRHRAIGLSCSFWKLELGNNRQTNSKSEDWMDVLIDVLHSQSVENQQDYTSTVIGPLLDYLSTSSDHDYQWVLPHWSSLARSLSLPGHSVTWKLCTCLSYL